MPCIRNDLLEENNMIKIIKKIVSKIAIVPDVHHLHTKIVSNVLEFIEEFA